MPLPSVTRNFELLSPERLRIGSINYTVRSDPSASDGEIYMLEASADPDQRHAQHLAPANLRGVRAADLPNGFYLSIERLSKAKPALRNIHFLVVRKESDQVRVSTTAAFDHSDWHLPESLVHFAHRYAVALSASLGLGSNVSVDENDTGVEVTVHTQPAPERDLFAEYTAVAEACLVVYRASIAERYSSQAIAKPERDLQPSTAPPTPAAPGDSAGAKWWFRYVLVPVIGSGAFAVLAAGILALLK